MKEVETTGEIVEMRSAKIATQPAMQPTATPMDLVRYAMDSGADIERLEKLMELQMKWEAGEARKAYVQAMADFKKNPPEIFKNKQVTFGDTSYNHATLGDVTSAVITGLAEHDISHDWDTKQESGRVIVTCTLTHIKGHSKGTTLEAAPDASGKKNGIQQIASTVTYLQRYTLLSAAGLAPKDLPDDDGRSSAPSVDLDEWVDKANAARTEDELRVISRAGVKEIKATGGRSDYATFAQAVQERGEKIKSAKAGKNTHTQGEVHAAT